jgi:hypothetical protein
VSIDLAIEHLRGVGSSARERDRAMARLAERQHGVVARRQLLELGFGRRAVTGRLQRGQLHEVFLGVYAVGARRISRKGRWMAAVLAAGEDALLSHRSAARLWGVLPPAAERIDITCPLGRIVRRSGIVSHESTVAEDEQGVVDGIPVTSVFRTIFDLAAVLDLRGLERALHEAEVRRLTDRVSLPMLLERYPGRRGARNLRTVLASKQPVAITRNDFEEAFLALVDAHGLPRPRMNADVALRGASSRSTPFGSRSGWRWSSTAAASTGRRSGSSPTVNATASSSPRAGARCASPGGSCRRNLSRWWRT